MSVRLQRAGSVVAYWHRRRLIFENYRTGVVVSANPITAAVLDLFREWQPREHCYRRMPPYSRSSIDEALRELTRRTFLLREGSVEARRDELFSKAWSSWLPHAGFLHFGSKDVAYTASEKGTRRILRRFLAASPQPAFFKNYRVSPQQRLPQAADGVSEFLRVLLSRRTVREFSGQALPLDALSQLLRYTWGVTEFADTPLLGKLPLKTSPSAGARHSGEVYILALRVTGLQPGLYHYAPHRHKLVQLRRGHFEKRAIEYCAGQTWVGKAAALFVMTAMFPRVMWKYRAARAYRAVLIEAGHLCQTFCLLATFLGLAPFCTMALKDSVLERDLGVDGIEESVIYVAGVGMPARDPELSSSRLLASL